ncbi:MAG: hypothetical protein JWQ91_2285 [Aeromicrobium sp.]|jgi:hypothetical protein|nr:hypothetical protein [Aeromicrobium sp.]
MSGISRPLVVVAALVVVAVVSTNPAQAVEGPRPAPASSSAR